MFYKSARWNGRKKLTDGFLILKVKNKPIWKTLPTQAREDEVKSKEISFAHNMSFRK